MKFTDDTTVGGLITNNNDMAYREEVGTLTAWYQVNKLSLNVRVTKELIVDFRRNQAGLTPLLINWSKTSSSLIYEKLKWSNHTDTVVKKARQRLFNLRMLKKCVLSPIALTVF
jgi:hypothetical protein